MSRRSSSAAPVQVPEQLKPLVKGLAELSDQDRELVIRAAKRKRRAKVELRPMAWDMLWQARGVVAIGGDAVDDTNAIYDDV